MPCSAPCNRLPCDERCTKLLPCRHQCPGLCGEDCPVDLCQACGMKADECPDLVMMEPYSNIDLNETPIVALGCEGKHFFTAQTLDGMIGMKEVYEIDPRTGEFVGLKDNPQLAAAVPQCPTCRKPISQYVTQRYNRLINRAVIDEMSKRFVVDGQRGITELEAVLENLELGLKISQGTLIPEEDDSIDEVGVQLRLTYVVAQTINERYQDADEIEKNVRSFERRTRNSHKLAHKLHEATVYALERDSKICKSLARMGLDDRVPSAPSGRTDRDQRIPLGAQLLYLNLKRIILNDKFEVFGIVTREIPAAASYGILNEPTEHMMRFFADCLETIEQCSDSQLPKLAVQATLYYAQIFHVCNSTKLDNESDRKNVAKLRETAKDLLEKAHKLCEQPFNVASAFSAAIERYISILSKEFYEEVTKAELDAIKKAMLGGRQGIATHSGHWYNCINGHTVSFIQIPGFGLTNINSLLSVSVEGLWRKLFVPSAAQPSEDSIIERPPESRAPQLWRTRSNRI
jgi:hypothetical protein